MILAEDYPSSTFALLEDGVAVDHQLVPVRIRLLLRVEA